MIVAGYTATISGDEPNIFFRSPSNGAGIDDVTHSLNPKTKPAKHERISEDFELWTNPLGT